jgi:predicted DNA-binding transcriptional regulator AlpA
MTDSSASVSISIGEAAKLVGISESLARQLAREHQFPGAFRLGGRILVHRQVLLEQLDTLARGGRLADNDPDRVLARAMGDARARLQSLSGRRRA